MLKTILALTFLGSVAGASSLQDDQRVNQHLNTTNSKLQLDREQTQVENDRTAPSLNRTPTFEDPKKYRSYGVDMQPQKLPFDDLDLDHLEQAQPESKTKIDPDPAD